MRFCDRCGNLMMIDKRRKNNFLVCRKCHKTVRMKGEKMLISEVVTDKKKEIVVMGKDEGVAELPTIEIMCPNCENNEAHWWMQQTRTADEPPTLFYRCKKCGYSWRSYG